MTLSRNWKFLLYWPQITINTGGSSNDCLNALHKEYNCFSHLFFFYPQAVNFLTLASSYFPSSNNVGHACTEYLVESKYFLDCVSSMHLNPYVETVTTSSLMMVLIIKPLCFKYRISTVTNILEKAVQMRLAKLSFASNHQSTGGKKEKRESPFKFLFFLFWKNSSSLNFLPKLPFC